MHSKLFRWVCTMLAAVSMHANAQTAAPLRLSIIGTMKNMHDTVVVVAADVNRIQNGLPIRTDTVAATKGEFKASVVMDEVCPVVVYNIKNGQPTNQFSFCGVPGESCTVVGDWLGDCQLSGSEFYSQYNAMTETTTPLQKESAELMKECDRRLAAGENEDTVMDYYNQKAGEIQDRITAAEMDFVRQHPTSECAAVLLHELPADKVKEAYEMIDASVKNGRMKNYIALAMGKADEELKRVEAAKALEVGNEAPDFTLQDINGQPLSLSSLRGKYVVIDFWGSWCTWCMKGMPKMKKYYKKYKEKMEILGIDCNETEKMWKEAVRLNRLPWKHVINAKGEDSVLTLYAVDGFPTKMVIDPEGRIARLFVGEDPSFYPYLDELFQ